MLRAHTSPRGVRVTLLLLLSVILVLALPLVGTAQESQQYTNDVRAHPSQNPDMPVIEGATATLETSSEGASFTFNATQLEPGHVHTLWVAVMNQPDQCANTPCAGSDILGLTDEVQADVVWGAGGVADENGELTLTGSVPAGDLPGSWFGNGLTNPQGAQIDLALNDHGPVIPDMREEMLSTYRAGCTDESLPPPYPDVAKADGTPGPNTCRLVQLVSFQQAGSPPATLPETGRASRDTGPVLLLLVIGGGLIVAGWHIRRRGQSAAL